MTNLISPTAWETGGPGAASGGETVSVTGTGAGTTYARQPVATVVGRLYWFAFTVDTAAVLPGRLVGTTAGGAQLWAAGTALAGSNARQFVATSTTTWVQVQRQNAGTATVSNIRLEAVERVGRTLNGTSQYFTLDAVAAGAPTRNHTLYVGGWVRFNAALSGGSYILDFGNTQNSAGNGRIRLIAQASATGAATKILASNSSADGAVYQESFGTVVIVPGTWYYMAAYANPECNIQVVFGATQPTGRTGSAPLPDATGVCRRLTLGAKYTTAASTFSPVTLSDWAWITFVPTAAQIQALAAGTRPTALAGLSPDYAWAMDHAGATEPSLTTALPFGAAGSPPVALVGADPDVPPPAPSTPLGVIII